jgi:ketosteroid isomerase-like protein
MSQENVELVRDALNAFIEVDEGLAEPQRLTEFFAPDGTWGFSDLVGQSELRDLNDFLEFRATWMKPYAEWRYDVEKILDAGVNRVVAMFHQRGKPRDSDSWVEMHYGIVYTVEEGLIRRAEFHATPEEALEAVGLSEQDAHADS